MQIKQRRTNEFVSSLFREPSKISLTARMKPRGPFSLPNEIFQPLAERTSLFLPGL